jgi:hypothetical protein
VDGVRRDRVDFFSFFQDSSFVKLVADCLQKDSSLRPPIDQLLIKHKAFFDKADKQAIVDIVKSLPPPDKRVMMILWEIFTFFSNIFALLGIDPLAKQHRVQLLLVEHGILELMKMTRKRQRLQQLLLLLVVVIKMLENCLR